MTTETEKELKNIKREIADLKLLMNVEIQVLKAILNEIQGGKRQWQVSHQ